MINFKLPQLRIGNLVARFPVIQGGMGVGVSRAGLASAVSNAGGIGVISAVGLGMFESDFTTNFREANKRALRKEIRKAKSLTNGILGVNIMVALSDFDELVKVALEEKVDMLLMGAGLPLRHPQKIPLDFLKRTKTKIAPIVSSARAAKLIFKSWERYYNYLPDAIIVEGPLAGGHLGFKKSQIHHPDFSLEKVLTETLAIVKPFVNRLRKKIPIIAAGGIFSGEDIRRFIKLGADGVQMATRFVATHECDASLEFKKAYVKSKEEDIILIDSPVGLPGRAIRNKFLNEVSAGHKKPFKCPWKCLKTCDYQKTPYCIAEALVNAQKGNLDKGFTFAGKNVYRVNDIIPVSELVQTLKTEYEVAISEEIFPSNNIQTPIPIDMEFSVGK